MLEIGPLLGGVLTPTPEHVTPVPGLDRVRLELVSGLLARAGQARARLAAGAGAAVAQAIGADAWLELWRTAVAGACNRTLVEIETRVRNAALVSRMPPRLLAARLPTPEDRRVLQARLDAAGIALEAAAARLDRDPEPSADALRRVAGELELAWAAACRVVRIELDQWEAVIAEIRDWRRPWIGFIAASALALSLAVWIGLVLGGYLPVPEWMRPFAEWAWSTGWL